MFEKEVVYRGGGGGAQQIFQQIRIFYLFIKVKKGGALVHVLYIRGVQPVALLHVRATDGSKRATSEFQVWPFFWQIHWRENIWSFAKFPLPGIKIGQIPLVRLFW